MGSMRKNAVVKTLVGYLVAPPIRTDVRNSATKRACLRRSSSFMFLVMSMRYAYYGRDIRRIGVRIKRYLPLLHGSVHLCNGSSPRKAAEGLGTSLHIYDSKYIFCRCPARSFGVLLGYERQRGCRRGCPLKN